jgi:hypothetical protein
MTPTHAIQFRPTGRKGYSHSVEGTLSAGAMVTIHASERIDQIDLTCLFGGHCSAMRFCAADARAVAAELIAAAAAVEAVQGGAA